MGSQYLEGGERLVQPQHFNLLLSHNPDVFRVAAQKGFDCTLSGHTHGGQLTVEILSEHLTLARMFTPYVYGVYRQDDAAIYVSRGVGTVGVPARVGAPPEIGLIRLCAT
jgi:predicted MPP superfamily phosphohydrolase